MEGHDEGGQYQRTGVYAAELFANDTSHSSGYEVGREPEVNMSEVATGTRGVANFQNLRRHDAGIKTGHLILRRPHIQLAQWDATEPGSDYWIG
jgi:hypothetical protein